MKYIVCIFKERRFIILFGVIYVVSMLGVIHRTSVIESDLEATEAKKILIKRKVDNDKAPVNVTRIRTPGEKRTVYATLKQPVEHHEDAGKLNCKDLEPPKFLEPGVLPLTALHSFPGSGNTWVRVLLSSTTGINTGDIYRDGAFAKTPGFSYRKDDTVIAVKTHHPFWDDNNGPDPSAPAGTYWKRAVVVVRHPLDATISVYNWFRMKGSHIKSASIDKYLKPDGTVTKEWNKWAHDQIRNWGRCLDYWINTFNGPKVIIFYEDLILNLEEQLTTMVEFLGLELDENRLRCTIESNAQQKFHRNQPIDKRLLYDKSMLEQAEKVLEDVKNLISTNYTHIRPGFRIPPNYASTLVRESFSVKPNILNVDSVR
ncbi:sialate:O-sulfotransferase 1-like [Watersipora subatra]|uniref:sialate:O-sulfotransferase 1-like n=1 Tax=Watersipora subatra TaxID=2589382 RepID=UPI00355B85FA